MLLSGYWLAWLSDCVSGLHYVAFQLHDVSARWRYHVHYRHILLQWRWPAVQPYYLAFICYGGYDFTLDRCHSTTLDFTFYDFYLLGDPHLSYTTALVLLMGQAMSWCAIAPVLRLEKQACTAEENFRRTIYPYRKFQKNPNTLRSAFFFASSAYRRNESS